jgi:hypothetical protein
VHVDAERAAVDLRRAHLDEPAQAGVELEALLEADHRGVRRGGVTAEVDAGLWGGGHALLTGRAAGL